MVSCPSCALQWNASLRGPVQQTSGSQKAGGIVAGFKCLAMAKSMAVLHRSIPMFSRIWVSCSPLSAALLDRRKIFQPASCPRHLKVSGAGCNSALPSAESSGPTRTPARPVGMCWRSLPFSVGGREVSRCWVWLSLPGLLPQVCGLSAQICFTSAIGTFERSADRAAPSGILFVVG